MEVTPSDNLQEAFRNAAPYSTVYLSEGEFYAKTLLSTPGLKITGKGPGKTRIIWDDYAKKTDPYGRELNTFRTWTMAVTADKVKFEGLSVVNSAGSPEIKGQEVALTVYGDLFEAYDCVFSSTQDTLFLGPLPPDLTERYKGFLPDCLRKPGCLRQSFTNCLIEGTVDFIFGCGSALFKDCEIRSQKDARDIGYVAAPAHEACQKEGFAFKNCRLTAAEGVTPESIFLARPWRDYGLCSFINCSIGGHINPLGFDKWNDTGRDKTARFYERPLPEGRVPWARSL